VLSVTEKRRLGRGLDALLGGTIEPDAHEKKPTAAQRTPAQVPLEKIEHNPYQPRKDFDPEELHALKESLDAHGLLQPVVVRPAGKGYQLVAGERRLRAAREAGWKEIPVRIIDLNDQEVFEAAMVENLQRADLNPIEKAQGFHQYLSQYGVTQDELARRMGLDRSTVSNFIRLLELPQAVQDAVRTGQITNGHARALLAADDPERQVTLCKQIVARGLSVRAVELLVKESPPPEANGASAPPVEKTAHVQAIEDELRQKLATRVEIRLRSSDKGQFVLAFESNDDFERILEVLRR
jgi:ParB family chromosome partitioning protein